MLRPHLWRSLNGGDVIEREIILLERLFYQCDGLGRKKVVVVVVLPLSRV